MEAAMGDTEEVTEAMVEGMAAMEEDMDTITTVGYWNINKRFEII